MNTSTLLDIHFSIGSIPHLKDRVITVNGVSKGFAMTGWRVGFIGFPWIAACSKIQGQVILPLVLISQKYNRNLVNADPSK